jgi:hypothetical protein
MGRRFVWAAVLSAAIVFAPCALGDLIEVIEAPSRVPHFDFISLGNGVAPGATGTYGFAIENKYNASMENVTLTVEIYRWETVEQALNATELPSPPLFIATGAFNQTFTIPSIAPNASVDVRAQVRADAKSPEGVYLTRHSLEFDYGNFTAPGNGTPRYAHFSMKSRGYFTAQEFASLNYSDLEASLDDLGVQGIIPDSSFSVKQPAPLWPLATLVVLTASTGTLSVAYWLSANNPSGHPRLTKALLRMEGKVRVWRFLALDGIRNRLGRRDRPPGG